jgi:hypothetical protein
MRTLIDLPEQQLAQLNRLAKTRSVSRAQVVREAVASYLDAAPELKARTDWVAEGFGALADTPFTIDGHSHADALDYQRRLRDEWDSPPAERASRTRGRP